jgi:toxin YoeB
MTYSLDYSDDALEGLAKLAKSEPMAFKKAKTLLKELETHPYTGTGHPHPLKEDRTGQWARSISKKHRLVYQVEDQQVLILVLSAYGHYDDK